MCYNVKQMDKKTFQKKLGEWWERYEVKIVLFAGFCLVAAISFEFGALYGQKWQQKPLIIEKKAENGTTVANTVQSVSTAQNLPQETHNADAKTLIPAAAIDKQDCQFVGSKNSNKYHLPSCRWAKQIKPENTVCFASAEAAAQQGYQPDKGCLK